MSVEPVHFVGSGSWSCENDFGAPKSPSDDPWILQEGRTEQLFRRAYNQFGWWKAS